MLPTRQVDALRRQYTARGIAVPAPYPPVLALPRVSAVRGGAQAALDAQPMRSLSAPFRLARQCCLARTFYTRLSSLSILEFSLHAVRGMKTVSSRIG